MGYKLSKRSLGKLEGVKPEMIEVVKTAIEFTTVDFGVIQGLRTIEQQRELVAKGASQKGLHPPPSPHSPSGQRD